MIKDMARVYYNLLMEIIMMENGKMTKKMVASNYINQKIESSKKEDGKITKKMVSSNYINQKIDYSKKEDGKIVINKVKENFNMIIKIYKKESGWMIKDMDRVYYKTLIRICI